LRRTKESGGSLVWIAAIEARRLLSNEMGVQMLRRSGGVKERAQSGQSLAVELAHDRKFRKQLMSAIEHSAAAKERARTRRAGFAATARRLAADEQLREELREVAMSVQKAWSRFEKKRSHKLRNTVLVVGAGGATAAAAVPQARRWITGRFSNVTSGRVASGPRVITESIEVDVPVSTAYNQWTQFEEFPRFMEGVEEVRQLDDTRLHWVATVAGKRAEWDAKILEQHPDRQVSWISEDGKSTRGTVTFEPVTAERARIQLSMSYMPEGAREALGSAAGLDARRVRGDLERFKELIESRGAESGAWRGEVSAGQTTESATDKSS
jgi:uncharacterized membrane protein